MKKWPYLLLFTALLTGGCGRFNFPLGNPSASALPLQYKNPAYGLTFSLSSSWQGYSVLSEQWEGHTYLSAIDTTLVVEDGPILVLRHPQWKANDPYQDIPILVFTRSQWDAERQGKFSLNDGGVEYEIGHNAQYVFAISSRYNIDDSVKAWKETDDILQQNQIGAPPVLYPR